jgi:hypothetical protein
MIKRGRVAAAGLSLTTAALGCSVLMAAPAHGAQQQIPITCGNTPLVISVNTNHSNMNGGWGAAQVVSGGSGHGIPTSFTFSAFDNTVQRALPFGGSSVKGNGNANQNQTATTCQITQTRTLAQIVGPGFTPPLPFQLTDSVTVTNVVTVVVQS